LKLCAGDKGAPGYSGLAGEDGNKVSAYTIDILLPNYIMNIHQLLLIYNYKIKSISTY